MSVKGYKIVASRLGAMFFDKNGNRTIVMEKESKYYTPSIEEFHVGFEFECTTSPNKDDWYHDVIRNVDDMCEVFSYSKARVKYLDREDIESLGFEYQGDFDSWERYSSEKYLIATSGNDTDNFITIETQGNTLFIGTIKNKSELKVLLKQLGI